MAYEHARIMAHRYHHHPLSHSFSMPLLLMTMAMAKGRILRGVRHKDLNTAFRRSPARSGAKWRSRSAAAIEDVRVLCPARTAMFQ